MFSNFNEQLKYTEKKKNEHNNTSSNLFATIISEGYNNKSYTGRVYFKNILFVVYETLENYKLECLFMYIILGIACSFLFKWITKQLMDNIYCINVAQNSYEFVIVLGFYNNYEKCIVFSGKWNWVIKNKIVKT